MTEIESQIRKPSREIIADKNVFIRWDNEKKDWVYVKQAPQSIVEKPQRAKMQQIEMDCVEPF